MNIIFGRDQATDLAEKYTVLELDTICVKPSNTEITAFCVIESLPILNMLKLESMKSLHENLLIEYRKCNWNYCEQALEHLVGFWGQDLDTFYENLKNRINEYKYKDLDGSWWIIAKGEYF
jgi:hypothetical protein